MTGGRGPVLLSLRTSGLRALQAVADAWLEAWQQLGLAGAALPALLPAHHLRAHFEAPAAVPNVALPRAAS